MMATITFPCFVIEKTHHETTTMFSRDSVLEMVGTKRLKTCIVEQMYKSNLHNLYKYGHNANKPDELIFGTDNK